VNLILFPKSLKEKSEDSKAENPWLVPEESLKIKSTKKKTLTKGEQNASKIKAQLKDGKSSSFLFFLRIVKY